MCVFMENKGKYVSCMDTCGSGETWVLTVNFLDLISVLLLIINLSVNI
jgi:hypothetical protein